ncbi:hypothetical protein DIPPA_31609 [Diplonema papillatum]|nr:hypothetical protein DIPPA_31609 [Diplonema papillatum]
MLRNTEPEDFFSEYSFWHALLFAHAMIPEKDDDEAAELEHRPQRDPRGHLEGAGLPVKARVPRLRPPPPRFDHFRPP